MMAFALESWITGPKDNSNYVQWVLQVNHGSAEKTEFSFYPMHKCTDEEFSRFHQFNDASAAKAKKLEESGHFLA